MRAIVDQCAIGIAVCRRARLVHGILNDQRHAILVLVERGDAFGELGRQHGKDFDAGVDRSGLAAGVAVDDCASRDASVHVGNADEHADAAIRQRFGPLDLV